MRISIVYKDTSIVVEEENLTSLKALLDTIKAITLALKELKEEIK